MTTIQDGLPFWIVDGGGASIYGAGSSRAALADPSVCNASGNCKSAIPIATSGSTTFRATPGNKWVNSAAFINLSPTAANPLPTDSPYCIGGTYTPSGSPLAPCGAAPSFFAPPGSPAALGSDYLNAGTGYGNSSIGSIMGPGQFDFDMSLIKTTKIWEHGTLEFHMDAFNMFNHPQFNPPAGNDVNVPSTFGVINSTSVAPRVIPVRCEVPVLAFKVVCGPVLPGPHPGRNGAFFSRAIGARQPRVSECQGRSPVPKLSLSTLDARASTCQCDMKRRKLLALWTRAKRSLKICFQNWLPSKRSE